MSAGCRKEGSEITADVQRILNAFTRLHAISELPMIMSGMRKSEFMTLRILADHVGDSTAGEPSGLTVSQLSHDLGVSPAAISQMANTLVCKGFVRRVPDEKDRRVVRLELTDAGQAVTTQIDRKLFALTQILLEKMGSEDARRFISLLDNASRIIAGEVRRLRDQSECSALAESGKERACENTSGT